MTADKTIIAINW